MNLNEQAIQYLECEMSIAENGTHFSLAIDALKKQIPVKPVTEDKKYYKCGKCGAYVTVSFKNRFMKRNYCYNCGQLVDWENIK